MSYAIVRNEKLTRSQAIGICVHNDRKAKNHSNKEIDTSKSNLNYYFKKNKLSYTKEFDRLRKKYDLQGQIRSNSIIMCEMIFTSDKEFFDTIGMEGTKRYFEESYKFICNYKNFVCHNIRVLTFSSSANSAACFDVLCLNFSGVYFSASLPRQSASWHI